MKKWRGRTEPRSYFEEPLDMSDPATVDALFGSPVVDPHPTPNPWEALVLSVLGLLALAVMWGAYAYYQSLGRM